MPAHVVILAEPVGTIEWQGSQYIVGAHVAVLRVQRVMLDANQAALYSVTTPRLSEQVRRNAARFPTDFMFRLATKEWETLSQIATTLRRSRRQGLAPHAFREHCCLMLANVFQAPKRGIGFTAPWPLEV